MALPEDIVIRVQRDFSSKESLPILQLLSEFQKENPDLSARVLRCIVFLARGSFENFASAVALARLDWRDLIVAAEYDGWSGEENKRRDMNLPFEATDNEAVKGPVPLTH
jgi:hypothetical protein